MGAVASFTTFAVKNLNNDELRAPEEESIINTEYLVASAGFVLVEIIFASISNKKMISAVKSYNQNLQSANSIFDRIKIIYHFKQNPYQHPVSKMHNLGIAVTF